MKPHFNELEYKLMKALDKSNNKYRKLLERFCQEFEHAERTSMAEPLDHEDCRRFYKVFKKALENKD